MKQRKIAIAAVLVAIVVTATGCADDPGIDVDQVPSEVTGVIVSIEPEEGRPETLTVRDEDDESHEIEIAEDIDYGFDLAHLHEHRTTTDPVIVTIEERDGRLVATAIEDA